MNLLRRRPKVRQKPPNFGVRDTPHVLEVEPPQWVCDWVPDDLNPGPDCPYCAGQMCARFDGLGCTHDRIERHGYRADRVEFESFDGRRTISLAQGDRCVLVQVIEDGSLIAGVVLSDTEADAMAQSLARRASYSREEKG